MTPSAYISPLVVGVPVAHTSGAVYGADGRNSAGFSPAAMDCASEIPQAVSFIGV
jgi:hypothetical protein